MEAHCRPRGWIAAGMVNRVHSTENLGPMHPAMRPVEPRVVQQQVDDDGSRQPPPWVVRTICVDFGSAMLLPAPGQQSRRRAVDRRTGERPADLLADLVGLIAFTTCEPPVRQPGEPAAYGQISDCDNR